MAMSLTHATLCRNCLKDAMDSKMGPGTTDIFINKTVTSDGGCPRCSKNNLYVCSTDDLFGADSIFMSMSRKGRAILEKDRYYWCPDCLEFWGV
jgi:hypothetical protein